MSKMLSTKQVRTRKIHKCHGCLKDILPNTLTERVTCICDSGIYSLYTCEACLKLQATLPSDYFDLDEGYPEGWAKDLEKE